MQYLLGLRGPAPPLGFQGWWRHIAGCWPDVASPAAVWADGTAVVGPGKMGRVQATGVDRGAQDDGGSGGSVGKEGGTMSEVVVYGL